MGVTAEGEARLLALVEGMPQMIWRAVGRGLWTWSSPQWERYTGQRQGDSREFGWLEALHPDDDAIARAAWQVAGARGEFRADLRIRARDGSYKWFQARGVPARDDEGAVTEWLGTATDIDDLRLLEAKQRVLVAELQHRTRNLLAVVHSVAMQTLRNAMDLEDFRERFETRLAALSRVQGLLSASEHEPITIGKLVALELTAIAAHNDNDQVDMSGSETILRNSSAQTVALAVHELSTNALKYGALSSDRGRLSIRWFEHLEDGIPWLRLEWRESGVVMAGERSTDRLGYGRLLIEQALPHQLRAKTALVFGDDGVRCTIDLPLDHQRVDDGVG